MLIYFYLILVLNPPKTLPARAAKLHGRCAPSPSGCSAEQKGAFSWGRTQLFLHLHWLVLRDTGTRCWWVCGEGLQVGEHPAPHRGFQLHPAASCPGQRWALPGPGPGSGTCLVGSKSFCSQTSPEKSSDPVHLLGCSSSARHPWAALTGCSTPCPAPCCHLQCWRCEELFRGLKSHHPRVSIPEAVQEHSSGKQFVSGHYPLLCFSGFVLFWVFSICFGKVIKWLKWFTFNFSFNGHA